MCRAFIKVVEGQVSAVQQQRATVEQRSDADGADVRTYLIGVNCQVNRT